VSPIAPCDVHRQVLVDAATGLRVSTDNGTRELRRQVYEFWPSDLLTLFEKAGVPRRSPPPFAPGAGVEATARHGKPPQIVSPADGKVYVVRPGDAANGTIAMQARTDADVKKLYWFAGKAFLGASTSREAIHWYPTPGSYQIVVLDDQGRSSLSKVTIQSTDAASSSSTKELAQAISNGPPFDRSERGM